MIDSTKILQDFPLLRQTGPDGKRICYLDSGATSQKPQSVIDAVTRYYEQFNAKTFNNLKWINFLKDNLTNSHKNRHYEEAYNV